VLGIAFKSGLKEKRRRGDKAGESMKKKVAMQLPAVAKEAPVSVRYGLELEALDAVAEIIEVLLRVPGMQTRS
jgi:hypothetical protein